MHARKTLYFVAFISMAGCSRERSGAGPGRLADIQMPGANSGQPPSLVWVDGDKASRGACSMNAQPTRAACSGGVATMAVADLQTKVAANGQTSLSALGVQTAAEVKRLKDGDPTIVALNGRVSQLQTQVTQLDRVISQTTSAVQSEQAEETDKAGRVAWYDAQLAAIDQQLAKDPSNPDLLSLKVQDSKDRAELAQAVAALNAEMKEQEGVLSQDRATEAQATTDLAAAKALYQKTYDGLVVASSELDRLAADTAQLQQALAAVPAVLALLKASDIVYDSALLQPAERGALALIGQVLSNGMGLKPGTYSDGSGSYCAQGIVPKYVNGALASISVTALAPCGVTFNVVCNSNGVCTGNLSGYTETVTPKDDTHYLFKESGDAEATFTYQHALTAADVGVGDGRIGVKAL